MSPSPLHPRGLPPWLTGRKSAPERLKTVREVNEERLADIHIGHLYRMTFGQTIASIAVLTIAAAVVILPFVYMLLISLKGPAEVGNGRWLPDEFQDFRTGRTAWIEISVPTDVAVKIYEMPSVPVLPAAATAYQPWPEPRPLPEASILAERISQEKLDRTSPEVRILLEAPDPGGSLGKSGAASVYVPSNTPGLFLPVEAKVWPRTFGAVLGRLLQNYHKLLNLDRLRWGTMVDWFTSGYPRWYFNSLFIAISTVIIGVFLDSLAAFAFAKYNFPFKRVLFAVLLGTLMIPYPVTLVPTFFLFAKLGFYNTYAALIIPGIVSAFGIFLVRQYMETIPDSMLDAARVDGANDFQVYRTVMLPAARPVLAALAVFRFIYQWNTYLYPLVLTNKDSMKTVQLGIATMEDMHGTVDYGMQMAGSALAVVPILIVYTFMQRHFITGITMGSAKG